MANILVVFPRLSFPKGYRQGELETRLFGRHAVSRLRASLSVEEVAEERQNVEKSRHNL